jgi:hypothetical protein
VIRGWKRTLPYTRRRSRWSRRSQKLLRFGHTGIVFDRGPKEFPVATLLPRAPRAHAAAMLGNLRRWLNERWLWLRPRSLPVLFAAAGAVAAALSWDALPHQQTPTLPAHYDGLTIHLVR